jgi:hypothetical protein
MEKSSFEKIKITEKNDLGIILNLNNEVIIYKN